MALMAIQTVFHGPTAKLGPRILAKCAAGKLFVSYDHKLDVEKNHIHAAMQLAERFGWGDEWHTGTLPNEDYVHVRSNQAFDLEGGPNDASERCVAVGGGASETEPRYL